MLSQRESHRPSPDRTRRSPSGLAHEDEAALQLYRRAVSRELVRRQVAKFGADLAALGAELQTLAEPPEPRCPGAPRWSRFH